MISNKDKIILGKLFKYYRKKQNISIEEIEQANISSVRTLYNSFDGKIIKNEELYLKYCLFFNHPYLNDIKLNEWLIDYIPRLLYAFNYFKEDIFEELSNEYKNIMKDYKNNAIYGEYYEAFEMLFRYYLNNNYLELNEVYELLYLVEINIFNEELNLYLLDYMFRSNNNYIGDKKLPDILVNNMKIINPEHCITKYQTGFNYRYKSNFKMALDLFENCYQESIIEENDYKQMRYLLAIYSIYKDIDNIKAQELSNEIIEIKNNKSLNKSLIIGINYNVGMQDYLNCNYERAYELFNENLIKYKVLTPLLFICSICSRTKKEYPKELISAEVEKRYDFIYLDYFRKKQNGEDCVKLAKYILNVIVPQKLLLEIYRNPYWSLYEYELKEMAKNDKKIRKYYIEYMDEFAKTVKND